MDEVHKPQHYKLFPDMEVVDLIREVLTDEEWKGYCKGNILKYRLRAGKKGDGMRDLAKSNVYDGWLKTDVASHPYWKEPAA